MKGLYSIWLIGAVICVSSCNSNDKKEEQKTPVNNDSGLQTNQPAVDTPVTTAYTGVDISPMDMSYFPVDYPKLKMTKSITTAPLARVIYSRPHLQGRKLFPDILKIGEPWRMGANEATELELFKDATIQGRKVPAGRYVLYCIPQQGKWTVVINSNIDTWGLHPDPSKDIAKFDVTTSETAWHLEYFSLVFENAENGANLLMAWDNIEAKLPFSF